MPPPDYANFAGGLAQYPLPASTANSLLQDADPAVFFALDYFAWAINAYAGVRLNAEATAIGGLVIPNAAPTGFPYDPIPFLVELQQASKLPLLGIFRRAGELEARTVAVQHDVATLVATFVLPPLTASQAERLVPALKAIKDILHFRGEQGSDPAYTPPGGTPGGLVWKAAGIEYLRFLRYTYGRWEASQTTFFPAVTVEFQMAELLSQAFSTPLAAIDVEVDLEASDGTAVANLGNRTAARLAPIVSSVSPSSGSTAGGTSITITGLNFVVGTTPQILTGGVTGIGAVAATAVHVASTTSVTAVTAGHSAIVGDVTVIAVDGQSATKSAAFTYA